MQQVKTPRASAAERRRKADTLKKQQGYQKVSLFLPAELVEKLDRWRATVTREDAMGVILRLALADKDRDGSTIENLMLRGWMEMENANRTKPQ